jgi:hypothetical protein
MTNPDLSDLAAFVSRFRYRADARDRWTLLDSPPFEGDCEDFALTAAWMIAGGWWRFWWGVVTCRFVFWMVWAEDPAGREAHCALWVRGLGWIDNIYPSFGARMHRLRWPVLAPLLAMTLLLKGRI